MLKRFYIRNPFRTFGADRERINPSFFSFSLFFPARLFRPTDRLHAFAITAGRMEKIDLTLGRRAPLDAFSYRTRAIPTRQNFGLGSRHAIFRRGGPKERLFSAERRPVFRETILRGRLSRLGHGGDGRGGGKKKFANVQRFVLPVFVERLFFFFFLPIFRFRARREISTDFAANFFRL